MGIRFNYQPNLPEDYIGSAHRSLDAWGPACVNDNHGCIGTKVGAYRHMVAYINMYIPIHIHICICIYKYIYIFFYYVHVFMHIPVYMYSCIFVYVSK